MKTIICFLLSISFAFAQKKSDWQSLFNGKNLDGWDIKISGREVNENYKNAFLVEDKMLTVSYK